MKLRTIVVDDEPLARELIRRLLSADVEVEIVAECPTGAEALAAISRHEPELVFLDVQMPGLSGLDVVARLPVKKCPYVVFVTAYDRYAIRAFEVQALDYLLKPLARERLLASVERAKAAIRDRRLGEAGRRMAALASELSRARAEFEVADGGPRHLSEFRVRDGREISTFPAEEVVWIEGANQYARLHVRGRAHLLSKSLAALEGDLDPRTFTRIHKSAIVNVAFVREVRSEKNGAYSVQLATGECLRLSRRRRSALEALIRSR